MSPRLRTSIYTVASVVFISKLLGFVRGIVIAQNFGTSVEYDLYLIGVMLPALASGVLGYACYYQFVPYFTRKVEEADSSDSPEFWYSSWSAINITILTGLSITVAIVLVAGYAINLWDTGWTDSQYEMIIFYCRLTAATVILSVTEAMMRALLNVRKIYTYPASGLSLFNIFAISAILLLHEQLSVGAIAVGLVGGMIVQNLYLLVRLLPSHPIRNFKARILDKESPLFVTVASALILIELINRSYFLIDRYFAPRLGEGIVSALNYGQILTQLPESVVGFAIGAVIFPVLSSKQDDDNIESFSVAYRKAITAALLFAIPLAVFAYTNAESLVHIIYQRGAFNERSTEMTALILRTLVPSVIGLLIISTSIRACYARNWTRPVLWSATLFLFVKLVGTALLPQWFGYAGISAATSVAHVGFGVGLMSYIITKWPSGDQRQFVVTLVKLILGGLFVYLAAYLFRRFTWPLVEQSSHFWMYLALFGSALIVFGTFLGLVSTLGFQRYLTDLLPRRHGSK